MTDPRPRSSFVADLRTVLAGSGFRKLFATRLISQTGDGLFNAGIGAYVFFSSTTFPNPAAAAASFAVLYLPYSLIGPFAGVFIDRWSRRQILLVSALIRACGGALIAALVLGGAFGLPIWLCALGVLGVNRFFLSSLSAALPHVIVPDELVMANSVGPTSGTVVSFIGGIAGIGIGLGVGTGRIGSAITLIAAASCFVLAALASTRMARASLGPDLGEARAGRLTTELGSVAAGLLAGLREIGQHRPTRGALAATSGNRFLYGILLLMSILLYRNYFYPGQHGTQALTHFLPVVISSAIGYGTAAWLTPVVTRRLSSPAWITLLLAAGGIITGALGPAFSQIGFVLIGFGLGVVAQGVAICSTTILQQSMADDYRGRVFSVYDMLFNVTFVAGAAFSAAFMPVTGHSLALLLTVAIGYLVAAVSYRLLAGQLKPGQPSARVGPGPGPGPGPPAPSPGPETASPDSRAQRSSS
ncbi:MAG TPA: MFS transporter [Streptosporangiaceae bacterium]